MAAILRALDLACEALAALLMCALTTIVFVGVVYRYVLLAPIPWTEEVARLCLVWVTFVGAYLAMRRGLHIMMDTLYDLFGPRGRRVCDALGLGVLAVFLAVLVWYGTRYAAAFWRAPSPYLGFPMGLVYLALPVGAGLLLLSLAPSLRILRQPPARETPRAP
jgi:TRAP-type C4-dicarboxylate transport system permease small subunit